jgi:hypothetical protein
MGDGPAPAMEARALSAYRRMQTGPGHRVRLEEAVNAIAHGEEIGERRPHEGHGVDALRPEAALHPRPEVLQPLQTVLGRIAGDQGRIDRPDRGSDHPVRFDPLFVQGFVDAGLVGAQRPAALQDQNSLARLVRPAI